MADEPVTTMEQMVSLEYKIHSTPLQRSYGRALREGRITGHKCPECSLVYSPPTGFCSLCVVPTSEQHEVEIADRGTITSFTIVDPIQYRGQEEREVYALASILLDGASGSIGQQRIGDVAPDEVRMGMRVEAAWLPEEERKGGAAQAALGGAIRHWRPNGEPDRPLEEFAEHII
ncbi:MAG: Zn-ribbon domain-containing OB-fold protein [Proteobacteria bacterium]|nr:Zn-ribbon domain-containing OB-fold protein [Pseudomonadota bacterium]